MAAELHPSSPLSDAETRALSHAKTFWRPVHLTPTVRALAARQLVEVIPLTGSVLSIWQWRITPADKAARGAQPAGAGPAQKPSGLGIQVQSDQRVTPAVDVKSRGAEPAGAWPVDPLLDRLVQHHPKGTLERKVTAAPVQRGLGAPAPPSPPRRADPAAAARAIERVLEDDGRGRFGGLGRREYGPAPVENKQALRDMLAQAAANTAKMQGKPG